MKALFAVSFVLAFATNAFAWEKYECEDGTLYHCTMGCTQGQWSCTEVGECDAQALKNGAPASEAMTVQTPRTKDDDDTSGSVAEPSCI